MASHHANEQYQKIIVRWSQLRANNAIGGDDAKWDADSLGLPVRVYAVIQFESSLGSGPEGLLMYSVEGHYSRGKTDSPPRGPRPGPSLVPERAAAMVALRRGRSPPFSTFLPPVICQRIQTIGPLPMCRHAPAPSSGLREGQHITVAHRRTIQKIGIINLKR